MVISCLQGQSRHDQHIFMGGVFTTHALYNCGWCDSKVVVDAVVTVMLMLTLSATLCKASCDHSSTDRHVVSMLIIMILADLL